MQTNIPPHRKKQAQLDQAESILRRCVHCGFCNATCPTYQIEGMEQEGPRGRIYLMKALLEGRTEPTPAVTRHLDHCLGCLACETTCPSGVRYSHLIDGAREQLEIQNTRSLAERLQRKMLAFLLPSPFRFRWAMRGGLLLRLLFKKTFLNALNVPAPITNMLAMLPARLPASVLLQEHYSALTKRKGTVILPLGCVQKVLFPAINEATCLVLRHAGYGVWIPPRQGCCGALTFHLGKTDEARRLMTRSIKVWEDALNQGANHIVSNASGCSSVMKTYDHIFSQHPFQAKAEKVSQAVVDITELLAPWEPPVLPALKGLKVAYHDACSLQHGQRLKTQPRQLLEKVGLTVLEVPQGHLCCGSAGTYNLLHPQNARILGKEKARHIAATEPDFIATGNVGCMEQIGLYSSLPVVHTVEVLAWAVSGTPPKALANTQGLS